MPKFSGPLPLAFILAIASDSAGANPAATVEDLNLEAGALRELLKKGAPGSAVDIMQSGDRRLPGDKTVQYFPNFPNFPNFFNCFNGYWRNC